MTLNDLTLEPRPRKLLDQVRSGSKGQALLLQHREDLRLLDSPLHSVLRQTPSNEIGIPEVTVFLTHLAVTERVIASTQNQALNAIFSLSLPTSRTQEIEAVITQIQKLHASGYKPEDIAVLYRYQPYTDVHLLNHLRQQLEELGLGCYSVMESRGSYSNYQKGVRLITALSSLGLEFKAVLILWVQQFGDRYSQEPEAAALARRQLYVAMTRAQEQLYLFGSGDAPILDELQQILLADFKCGKKVATSTKPAAIEVQFLSR